MNPEQRDDGIVADLGGPAGVQRIAYRSLEQGFGKILTIASALLGLSVTFRSSLVGQNPRGTWLLVMSWVALSLCIYLCVRLYFTVYRILSNLADSAKSTEKIQSGDLDKVIQQMTADKELIIEAAQSTVPAADALLERLQKAGTPPTREEMRELVDIVLRSLRLGEKEMLDIAKRLGAGMSELSHVVARAKRARSEGISALRSAKATWYSISALFAIGLGALTLFGALNVGQR